MFQHKTQAGFTGALSTAGLGIGATPAQLSIAAPNGTGIDYSILGMAYHLADAADVAMSPMAVQAAETTCLYLAAVDTAGTLSTVKGVEIETSAITDGSRVLQWPEVKAGLCPIGGVKVSTVGVQFTGGTTALNAAGITNTFYSFSAGMPGSPVTG